MSTLLEDCSGDEALMKFEQALETMMPSTIRHKVEACFMKSYEAIERSLARKVNQKSVLDAFNAVYGLKTHAARFRKMLVDERSRRRCEGQSVICKHCSQPIVAAPHNPLEDVDPSRDAAMGSEVMA